MGKFNNDNRFDVDLEFGQLGEKYVNWVFDGDGRIEVKTERDIWKSSKNIAFEYESRGKKSNLNVTKAKTYIIVFTHFGKIEFSLMFNVKDLKDRLNKLLEEGKAWKTVGGDDNTSKLLIVPIRYMLDI